MGVNKDRNTYRFNLISIQRKEKDSIGYSFIRYYHLFFDTLFIQDNNRRSNKFHHKSITLIDNQQQH